MKFRFYITSAYDGEVLGTDDIESAENFAESDDYFVVDSETGERIMDGERISVKIID